MKKNYREDKTHIAIVGAIKMILPIPFEIVRVYNEGMRDLPAGLGLLTGMNIGASDLMVFTDTKYTPNTIFIECKTTELKESKKRGVERFRLKETTQSEGQKIFEAKVMGLGFPYWLCPTVDSVILKLEEWCQNNGLVSRMVPNYRR